MVRIVVTGGTGYLGQFLLSALGQRPGVSLEYLFCHMDFSSSLFKGYKVNFITGDGLDAVFATPVDVVINSAAMSQPAGCESDETAAHGVNVPSKVLEHLARQKEATGREALLIHISTDHVYKGLRPMWSEEDPTEPINAYGRSKVAAEKAVLSSWPNSIVLRPSMIIGKAPPIQPVGRGLFLQWVAANLQKNEPTNLFTDEYRTPTYVADIVRAVQAILDKAEAAGVAPRSGSGDLGLPRVLNVACPERLSRREMGEVLCRVQGLSGDAIRPVARIGNPQAPAFIPLDISMKTVKIEAALGIKMTPFEQALKEIFA